MASLLSRTLILAKAQTAEGTAATPTSAADALLIGGEVNVKPVGDLIARDIITPSWSRLGSVISFRHLELDGFHTELRGKATAVFDATTNKLRDDPLWQAGGCTVSYAANSSSVTIAPTSNTLGAAAVVKPATIWAFCDGILYAGYDCRATANITWEDGNYGRANWTVRGLFATIPSGAGSNPATDGIMDSPIPTSPVYDAFSTDPPQFMKDNGCRVNFGVDAYPILQSFSLDLGNDIQYRQNANRAQGLEGVLIGGRPNGVTGRFNPELTLKATAGQDYYYYWQNRVRGVVDINAGSVAGNRLRVQCGSILIDSVDTANRTTLRTLDIGFTACRVASAGDDEFSIMIY